MLRTLLTEPDRPEKDIVIERHGTTPTTETRRAILKEVYRHGAFALTSPQ